MSNEQK